ncbi:unnamed protein product [Macrosiphum euphorbiae]|uniref:NADH dehydrogenase subunit 6 n=1 Tax=Macrosiphum euphorbiae TaxID=13131 RepID=A0AAV0WI33_9HEMI|nr:unnamed protein product [Macrosiphum euphorbiae]
MPIGFHVVVGLTPVSFGWVQRSVGFSLYVVICGPLFFVLSLLGNSTQWFWFSKWPVMGGFCTLVLVLVHDVAVITFVMLVVTIGLVPWVGNGVQCTLGIPLLLSSGKPCDS